MHYQTNNYNFKNLKMKRIIFLLTISGFIFLLQGCGGVGSNPKTTLNAFFDAMSKKDIPAVRKLTTADSKGMIDMMEKGLQMANEKDKTEKYDKQRMEIGEALIEGDKAIIPIKDKVSGESSKFILKKEDGSWKVAFDMGSIMEMANDKMKEKGFNADSLSKMMDEMKNINIDSLTKSFDKSPGSIDSLKELLKKIKK
jgi:hypothetical protein